MSKKTLGNLLAEMNSLWEKHKTCRSRFAHVPFKMKGTRGPITAPYYDDNDRTVILSFDKPLTGSDIDKMHEVDRYLNQNFIVRLFALLESYEVTKSSIDKSIPGREHIDILRRLRNRFAHFGGKYNPEKKKDRKLRWDLIELYDLKDDQSDDFPLPIDTVLEPMFEQCRVYAQEFWRKNLSKSETGISGPEQERIM